MLQEAIFLRRAACMIFIMLMLLNVILPKGYAADGAEVFDIEKGEVVKVLGNSASLQDEVEKWLSSISGIVGSMKVEPENGIGIKIDLTPPLQVENPWLKETVTEVILFVSKAKSYYPTLLIITKENRVIGVNIHADLMGFLREYQLYSPDFHLESLPGNK